MSSGVQKGQEQEKVPDSPLPCGRDAPARLPALLLRLRDRRAGSLRGLFPSGGGSVLRDEGQPLLAAPDPGSGAGREAGGEGAGAAAGLGADPSGGGSGEPPRPQRFSPLRPPVRAPRSSSKSL